MQEIGIQFLYKDDNFSLTILKWKKFSNANFFLLNSLISKEFKNDFLKYFSSKVKNTQSSKVYTDAALGCL